MPGVEPYGGFGRTSKSVNLKVPYKSWKIAYHVLYGNLGVERCVHPTQE